MPQRNDDEATTVASARTSTDDEPTASGHT